MIVARLSTQERETAAALAKHRRVCGECQAILRHGHGAGDNAPFCSIHTAMLYMLLNARKEN